MNPYEYIAPRKPGIYQLGGFGTSDIEYWQLTPPDAPLSYAWVPVNHHLTEETIVVSEQEMAEMIKEGGIRELTPYNGKEFSFGPFYGSGF